jgi:hypothetical protein
MNKIQNEINNMNDIQNQGNACIYDKEKRQYVISYDIEDNVEDAAILFFDLNGKLIRTFKLYNKKGIQIILPNEFDNGMYYYSLFLDYKEIYSKRILLNNNK